jgi:hypothetical protein
METQSEELKNDRGADGFCLKQFFATEAAFRSILLLFNLVAEFHRAAGFSCYQQPATLRAQVLAAPFSAAPVAKSCFTCRKAGVVSPTAFPC